MREIRILSGFARYAWFVLAYNVLVILWGVFLRASHSGDGCGQHWLTCHGEVVPSAPQLKTIIEYSHRLTTALAFFAVLGLVIWAFRRFPKGSAVRTVASLSLFFIIAESLIGAGLVLTGNTADNWTPTRPLWTIAHLINTLLLLTPLTLTAWLAARDGRGSFEFRSASKWPIALSFLCFVAAGVTGSMAALSNMFFPSTSIAEGIAKDFAADSSLLLRLRIFHPIVSILAGVAIIFLAGRVKAIGEGSKAISFWTNTLTALVLAQVAFGGLTLLMLAPIVMQLGHLLLADLVWIALVLLSVNVLYRADEAV